jgi:hypothetical protein
MKYVKDCSESSYMKKLIRLVKNELTMFRRSCRKMRCRNCVHFSPHEVIFGIYDGILRSLRERGGMK